MQLPAIRLREGDRITLPTRDGEHIVQHVTALPEHTAELSLLKVETPTHADDYVCDEGRLVNVTARHRQDHVEVRWTILDPMTDQLITDRRTDRVNLAQTRANGRDDVTGIQQILAVKQFGTNLYAPSVVILSVREV